MRKKPLILVAFLMMSLCMIPSVTAGYGDESPQSITSFSETLPDDVLFFPDPVSIASGLYFADSGDDGDWENTFEKDGVYFNVTDGDDINIHFVCNATNVLIEKWEYAIFGFEIDDDGDSKYYQYPGWTALETFNVTPSFYNGSIEPAGGLHGISNNYTLTLKFSIDYSATLCIDYVHIRFTYLLSDPDYYAENFADISDWDKNDCEGDDTITSDGDIASIECGQTGDDSDRFYTNVPDFSNFEGYLELRYRVNTTDIYYISLDTFTEDDLAGDYNSDAQSLSFLVDVWYTQKWYLSTDVIGSLRISVRTGEAKPGPVKLEIDYLRLSPANELGWQHDGSTTQGVAQVGGGIFSSDGDYVTMTADGDGSRFDFFFDDTDTRATLNPDYYPFVEIQFHPDDVGKNIKVESYTSGVGYNTLQETCPLTQTMRWNLRTLTDVGIHQLRLWVTFNQFVRVDLVKAYSIANYTVTQSVSCETSDIFYIDDSGALIGSKTTDYYQTFWYDPVSSVDTEMYNVVEANITKAGYPNVVGFNWAGTITGIGETWYLVDEKRATLDPSVLTDMRFSIDVLGDWTLYGIAYIDDHTWRGFTTVTVWFEVEAFTGTLGMLLIFGGLILIPASTLYAVKGGREAMNTDKLFYFLIAFVIGWALVIGGIYA